MKWESNLIKINSKRCTQDKYWNGTYCVIKKPFNSTCSATSECRDYNSVLCLNSICT